MLRNGAPCDFVLAVACARCSILRLSEGCRITFSKPAPLDKEDELGLSNLGSGSGNFGIDDSRISEG